MRFAASALCLVASSGIALAGGGGASVERPAARPMSVDATIDRGVGFLVKDALAWRNAHHCVSCHHAGLVIWSMREAKQRGRTVDEPVLAELTKWIAESGDGRTSVPRPAGIPKAINFKALNFALALISDPHPDAVSQKGLKLFLETLKSDQTANGSWAAWTNTRPPMFDQSDEIATAMSVLAFLPAAEGGDRSAKAARDKGLQWLTETKTDDDPQSVAMRLVLWKRIGRPAAECRALAERITRRQNADGGWSQTKDMPSDAWATGQALFALAQAGIKPGDPLVARAQAFLIQKQRGDGSWPMISRPVKPGGAGATSLIPITSAGSAWAVIGLARSR